MVCLNNIINNIRGRRRANGAGLINGHLWVRSFRTQTCWSRRRPRVHSAVPSSWACVPAQQSSLAVAASRAASWSHCFVRACILHGSWPRWCSSSRERSCRGIRPCRQVGAPGAVPSECCRSAPTSWSWIQPTRRGEGRPSKGIVCRAIGSSNSQSAGCGSGIFGYQAPAAIRSCTLLTWSASVP